MARKPTVSTDSVAGDQLRAFFERIERLDEEVKALNDDKKEVFAEAKGNGFDTKVMKIILKERRQDVSERLEIEALVELYRAALGMAAYPREEDDDEDEPEAGTPVATRAPARPVKQISSGSIEADSDAVPYNSASEQPGGQAEADRPSVSANQSTAARKDVQSGGSKLGSDAGYDGIRAPVNSGFGSHTSQGNPTAGTQAPPVDTTFAPGSIRYERTPPVGIVRHEYQRCFPEAWGPALGDLKDDIRANGVRDPILMQGNILLDGWSRFMACRDLKIEYPVKEYDGTDPLADIIKLNMASRGLNLAERISIARKLIKAAPDREADIAELMDLDQQRDAAQ